MASIPWSVAEDSLDVNFSVPQLLRLRCTRNCFTDDWDQVLPLLKTDSAKARVQVWIDQGVVDSNPSVLTDLSRRLAESDNLIDLVAPIALVDGGEQIKNDPDSIESIFRAIDRDGLDRRSYVLVIGGGAVLDAVGYAAAIAHRGIRLIRFPTTTLGQADSGVGVKNAINAYGKKNWKGTFSVPWAVVNDQSLIANLPDRDFRAGFSEAVKVSLLKSPSAFRFLCDHATAIANRDWNAVMPAIRSSVLMHLYHITHGGDPFVCSVQAHRHGEPLQRAAIRRRFLSACKVLGLARLRTLTIHHGRHTFISHALAGERTLAEVRTAAGHTNIAVTSIYLHIAVDDDDGVGDLFGAKR